MLQEAKDSLHCLETMQASHTAKPSHIPLDLDHSPTVPVLGNHTARPTFFSANGQPHPISTPTSQSCLQPCLCLSIQLSSDLQHSCYLSLSPILRRHSQFCLAVGKAQLPGGTCKLPAENSMPLSPPLATAPAFPVLSPSHISTRLGCQLL